jgi:hypothetical protein
MIEAHKATKCAVISTEVSERGPFGAGRAVERENGQKIIIVPVSQVVVKKKKRSNDLHTKIGDQLLNKHKL